MADTDIKLPQPVALKTELALAMGLAPDELLSIAEQQDWDKLPELPEDRGTWQGWIDFAIGSLDALRTALSRGYRISFTTIGGVRQLLDIKWGLEAGKDYTAGEDYADAVPLAPEQAELLQRLITVPWEMVAAETAAASKGQRQTYRIAHRK